MTRGTRRTNLVPGFFAPDFCCLAACILWFASALPAFCQRQQSERPAPIDPAHAASEARAIVAEMLAQTPASNSTNTGQIRIRDREGNEREIPARFEIIVGPTNWLNVYETLDASNHAVATKLIVTHTDNAANRYQIAEGTNSTPKELTPQQAMAPFAGSDFWIADLALDFLHWPGQRLLKREMRHSKSCNVLESTNPNPAPGGYSRVESWIIIDGPRGIVHADAYNSRNEKLKEFDPVNLEKIQGQYQLEEMEMRNRQTGSHTWIKFNLPKE